MGSTNEIRLKLSYMFLAIGGALLALTFFSDSGVAWLGTFAGWGFVFLGSFLLILIGISHGSMFSIRLIGRLATPRWDGEKLFTASGEFEIKYAFDEFGIPWFVASDICAAIGVQGPSKAAIKWGRFGGIPLVKNNNYIGFSEKGVQDYLSALATHNFEAHKLLILIRKQVLIKIEKQRNSNQTYTS